MRKTLSAIGLSVIIAACAAKKPATKAPVPQAHTSANTAKPKPEIRKPVVEKEHGVEFFKTNIADPAKNDNTASFGSIVSANPLPYKVVKTYFPALAQNFRQRFIILHYTALDNDRSVNVLTQQAVSAHYLVNDLADNDIYQLVDENKRAYHAGISSWRGTQGLNDTSIGIEIVNQARDIPGGGYDFPPFPEAQVRKIAALVKDIAVRYQIPATNILAHSDIAPTRKQDPGPRFPWKRLYTDYQIGMWYDDATKQNFMSQIQPEIFAAQLATPQFIFKVQSMLKDFGYGIDPSGTWDASTAKTVAAFQYHFRPENYSGILDMETYAILQALLQKYPSK